MAKQWMEIKNEIEDEIDRIWFKVPEEIEMAMKGCFPSGANVDGSAFGDMYWLTTELGLLCVYRHMMTVTLNLPKSLIFRLYK